MMKKIALLQFDNDPWTKILKIALEETLKNNYEITFLKDAYPKKNDKFTFIFMLGIRPIIKKNLDGSRIKKQTRFLIEFGDYSHDQRTSVEDCYFYFLEGDSKYANHYRKLPKFIFDHLLFQEQNDENITIFVDHFLGRDSYNDLVYDQISSCPFPLRVFYQHHSGIIENPDKKTFLSTIDPYNKKFKFIPFDEIAKIYRQTHAFFPTHSETQGMVALEIGACGGLTFMKPNTYPGDVPTKFYHVYYDEDHPIDWKYFLEETGPEKRIKYRDQVLKEYTFNLFKNELLENLKDIEANGPNKLS